LFNLKTSKPWFTRTSSMDHQVSSWNRRHWCSRRHVGTADDRDIDTIASVCWGHWNDLAKWLEAVIEHVSYEIIETIVKSLGRKNRAPNDRLQTRPRDGI